mgnify:FL=1
MNKAQFLEAFDLCIADKEVNLIVVAVEGVADYEELIINPRENFETKRTYYEETYNDDMRLSFKPEIGITWISGLGNFNELAYDKEVTE